MSEYNTSAPTTFYLSAPWGTPEPQDVPTRTSAVPVSIYATIAHFTTTEVLP